MSLVLRRPLLTLYTSICYAAVLCATMGAGTEGQRLRVGPRRTRPALPLPWLYLTSIIKINRPISYVKYYRRAFLNILSLSTLPRLSPTDAASLLSFCRRNKGAQSETENGGGGGGSSISLFVPRYRVRGSATFLAFPATFTTVSPHLPTDFPRRPAN